LFVKWEFGFFWLYYCMAERVCIFTAVQDSRYEYTGTPKLISSFLYFHPEIDFYCFGSEVVDKLFRMDPALNWYNSKARMAKLLYNDYDNVIHFDADTMILAPLDEMLTEDYEIAAALNHNWFDPHCQTLLNINVHEFVGDCTWSCRNKTFLDDLDYACQYAWPCGKGRKDFPWASQGCFNMLFFYLPWNKKALGVHGDNGDVRYGRKYWGSQTLNRWNDFQLDGDKVKLYGNQVVTLHEGGGYARKGEPGSPRLDFRHAGCKQAVQDYLAKLSSVPFTIDRTTGKVTLRR